MGTIAKLRLQRQLLLELFQEIDDDRSGTIEEHEWDEKVMGNEGMIESLTAAAEVEKRDMIDAFNAVASSGSNGQGKKQIDYGELVDYITHDSRVNADKRSVLKMRQQLEFLTQENEDTIKQIEQLTSRVDRMTRLSQGG